MPQKTDLNLHQKLLKIANMAGVLQKNKAGFNYSYVTEDEIQAKITAGMQKYGVMLYPSLVPNSLHRLSALVLHTAIDIICSKHYNLRLRKMTPTIIEASKRRLKSLKKNNFKKNKPKNLQKLLKPLLIKARSLSMLELRRT